MVFLLSNGGKVEISENALEKMRVFRQVNKQDFEAGGVLVGRFILGSHDIVIDDISTPMLKDKRKRMFFKRDKKEHQNFLYKIWEESQGTCNYLGEWHTHPEPFPTPSSHDLKEWKRILKEVDCESEIILFIIVGINGINVWEGSLESGLIEKLKED